MRAKSPYITLSFSMVGHTERIAECAACPRFDVFNGARPLAIEHRNDGADLGKQVRCHHEVRGARRQDRVQALARELIAGGGKAIAVRTDVTERAQVKNLVNAERNSSLKAPVGRLFRSGFTEPSV